MAGLQPLLLGVLNVLGGHRRDALWSVETPREREPDLFDQVIGGGQITSPLAPWARANACRPTTTA